MKKVLIFIIANLFTFPTLFSQDIKTGEGESSILLPTTNIGIDVGESSITFKTNNFPQSKLKSNGTIWGINAKGKSKEGLASVFSSSEIVPSSNLSAILGYSFSNSKKISDSYTSNCKENIKNQVLKLSEEFRISFDSLLIVEIRRIESVKAKEYLLEKVQPALKIEYLKYNKLEKLLKKISNDIAIDPEISSSAEIIYDFMSENKTWQSIKKLNKEIETGIDEIESEEYWKLTFYGHFGIQGEKFNTFQGWDSTNIENSFKKETFSGSLGGFGINYLFNSKWVLGIRYTYEETNNLDNLSTSEYKVTTSYTQNNSVGSTQVAKTAYPNDYKPAYLNRYDFDIIRFFNVGENTVIISNLYLRFHESTNEDNLVSQRDLGISSSFFKKKGKFIGGIYLELPDYQQNEEKMKPEAEQELKEWYNRLTFGVYANYSFSTIANLF